MCPSESFSHSFFLVYFCFPVELTPSLGLSLVLVVFPVSSCFVLSLFCPSFFVIICSSCLEVCLCMILFVFFFSYQARHRLGTSFWCLSCIFLYWFHLSFFSPFAEDPAQGFNTHKSQSSGNRQCPLLNHAVATLADSRRSCGTVKFLSLTAGLLSVAASPFSSFCHTWSIFFCFVLPLVSIFASFYLGKALHPLIS